MTPLPQIDLLDACRTAVGNHGEETAWSGRPDLPAFLRRERVIANRSEARSRHRTARSVLMISTAAVVAPLVAQVTFLGDLLRVPLALVMLAGLVCAYLAYRAADRAEAKILRLWGREQMLEHVAYAVSDKALYVAEGGAPGEAMVTRYDASTILRVEMSLRDGGSHDLDLWVAQGRLRLQALPDAQAALDCLSPLAAGITRSVIRA